MNYGLLIEEHIAHFIGGESEAQRSTVGSARSHS